MCGGGRLLGRESRASEGVEEGKLRVQVTPELLKCAGTLPSDRGERGLDQLLERCSHRTIRGGPSHDLQGAAPAA